MMKNLFFLRSNTKLCHGGGHQILRAQLTLFSTTSSSSSSSQAVDTLFSRITRAGYPVISVVPVIEKWLEEGKHIKQSELQNCIRHLRKYRRFNHALQISEWMGYQGGYNLLPGDIAVRLDLISKVHGLAKAEEYFNSIPDDSKGHQVYGALLNCYAHFKVLAKSEAIMQEMKDLGLVKNSLSYNVMLKLYSQLGKYEKLDPLMQEMEEKGIKCDQFTYNIRLNAHVVSSDIEGMEKLLMKMEVDPQIMMDFHAYAVAANGYLRAGLVDKALIMLKISEQLIRGNSRRFAYEIILTSYAAAGHKAEVYRIWNDYKKIGRFFNSGYMCMISSLVKLDDVDGAETIWEEWNSGKVLFDIRIPNLMIYAYSKKGLWEKAEAQITKIVESGNEPNATSWDHLATGYHASGQMTKAAEAIKKAISTTNSKSKPGWQPSFKTLCSCLQYLKRQGDVEMAEELLKMAMEHCRYSDSARARLLGYLKAENITDDDFIQVENDDQNFGDEPPTVLELTEKGST